MATGAGEAPSGRRTTWVVALVLVLVGGLLYAPTLDAGLLETWDDDAYVLENDALTAPGGLARIWSTRELPEGYPNYPLTFTSFWVEARLFDLAPAALHATNVALHLLSAVLTLLLARRLGLDAIGAGVVAALFLLHPMHVESVAWVTERKNVLSHALVLASFLCFLRARPETPAEAEPARPAARHPLANELAGYAFYVAALLAKTTALTLPAVLWLADVYLLRRDGRRALLRAAPLLAIGAVFALSTIDVEGTTALGTVEPGARPGLTAMATWFYLGKLLLPVQLLPVYPRWDLDGILPSVALIALASVVVLLFVARHRLRPLVLWGLAAFFVTALPTLGIVDFAYLAHAHAADRFVYAASTAFFVALVAALGPAVARLPRLVSTASVATILGLLAVRAHLQLPVWASDEALWTYVAARNPQSEDAHQGLAFVALRHARETGDPSWNERAEDHYRAALEANPDLPNVRVDLALLLARRGQLDEALAQTSRALELRPGWAQGHLNRATIWTQAGRADQAERDYRTALASEPDYALAHKGLGVLLLQAGRLDEGLVHLDRAAAGLPADAEVQYNAARAHELRGDRTSALAAARRAASLAETQNRTRLAAESRALVQRLGSTP